MVRLLQGCFNLRPPAPRYLSTWDPDQVLSFAESIFSTPEKFLTEKLITLLALATLMRVSELASINRSSIQISAIEVKFALLRARERQRQCPLTTFTLKRHTNKAVCPVECLERYLNVTSNLLNPNNGNALFLCQVRPHLPASSSTIARWIKFFLDKAGIGTAQFKAHSTQVRQRPKPQTAACLYSRSFKQEIGRRRAPSQDSTEGKFRTQRAVL